MQILPAELSFHDARIVQITNYPSQKGPKCVLILEASCMPHHADVLGCPYIYKQGIPVADLQKLSIDGEYTDIDMYLPNAAKDDVERYSPDIVYKISLERVEDAKFLVRLKIHESTRRSDLDMLLTAFNTEEFSAKFVSKQQTLFDGGTRVDMSGDEKPEVEEIDRSHENKPKGGRRGRPKKTVEEEVATAIVEESVQSKKDDDWSDLFDGKVADVTQPIEDGVEVV